MLAVIDSKEGVACEKVSHFEDRASEFDGLCVDINDILYVTEWYNNSSVCMFTTGQWRVSRMCWRWLSI